MARARFGPEAFREACALRLRSEPAPAPPTAELRSLGPLSFLESGAAPPARAWTTTLHPAEDAEDPSRVGIFVRDGGRFRYIGGERSADGGWSIEVRTLLGLGLFEDRQAPTLGPPRLEQRHGRLCLLFLAEDAGSGIDCDAVEVFFAGAPIVHELDDETGDVVAYPGIIPPGSEGTFELRATDRCGNASRRVDKLRTP